MPWLFLWLMSTETVKTQRLNILLVEDTELDRKLIEGLLREKASDYNLIVSKSLNEAKQALSAKGVDVVLLDLNLQDSSGRQTVLDLANLSPSAAIVVITGAFEDDMGVETLSLGVQDFLVKGKFTGYVLNKAIRYAVERKRLEVELRQAYERLKKMQTQLIQAEKLKVVGGLASGVAHEVKNPLSTIIYGITYLANELKSKSDNVAFVVENIHDAANRASHIISDLLDFSSMNHVELADADLTTIVDQALKLTHHEYHKRRIEIVKNFTADLPVLSIDPNRIEQVMVNLLLNAFYAVVKDGTVTLTTKKVGRDEAGALANFHFSDKDEAQTYVAFLCDDSGPGIPDDKVTELFDPFFTTRRADGGVGLGLSVSKTIVDMHHAYITLENRKGGGARAALLFPVKGSFAK